MCRWTVHDKTKTNTQVYNYFHRVLARTDEDVCKNILIKTSNFGWTTKNYGMGKIKAMTGLGDM